MPELKSVIKIIGFIFLPEASNTTVFPNTTIQTQEKMTGFIAFHLRALRLKSFIMEGKKSHSFLHFYESDNLVSSTLWSGNTVLFANVLCNIPVLHIKFNWNLWIETASVRDAKSLHQNIMCVLYMQVTHAH